MTVLEEVIALYARQSHAIDGGDAEAWARTFTEEGVFASPTYGDPIRGRAALTSLAAGIFRHHESAGVRERHWVNNVCVEDTGARVTAKAYLMIVHISAEGAPSLSRHVTFSDVLSMEADRGWSVERREVRVDP